jgi:hypothetical protein
LTSLVRLNGFGRLKQVRKAVHNIVA